MQLDLIDVLQTKMREQKNAREKKHTAKTQISGRQSRPTRFRVLQRCSALLSFQQLSNRARVHEIPKTNRTQPNETKNKRQQNKNKQQQKTENKKREQTLYVWANGKNTTLYAYYVARLGLEHVQKHLANVDGLQRGGGCGHATFCAQSPSADALHCNGVDGFGKFVGAIVSVVGLSEDVVAFVSVVDNNDWFVHGLLTTVWHWFERGAFASPASFGWMGSLAMSWSGTSVTLWAKSGWMIVSTVGSVSAAVCGASHTSAALAFSFWSRGRHWPNTTTLSPTATSSCFLWPLLVLYIDNGFLVTYTGITQINYDNGRFSGMLEMIVIVLLLLWHQTMNEMHE